MRKIERVEREIIKTKTDQNSKKIPKCILSFHSSYLHTLGNLCVLKKISNWDKKESMKKDIPTWEKV